LQFISEREYILFRDAEHSGTGSATESVTTNSCRFPELISVPEFLTRIGSALDAEAVIE
jgi:hypothetical protein